MAKLEEHHENGEEEAGEKLGEAMVSLEGRIPLNAREERYNYGHDAIDPFTCVLANK